MNRFTGRVCAVLAALVVLGGCAGIADSGPVTVLYEVTGSATQADITLENGGGGTSQLTEVDVPLALKSGEKGLTYTMKSGDFVYISAQNPNDDDASITCTITVDGTVVETSTSSGSFTIATCSGSA